MRTTFDTIGKARCKILGEYLVEKQTTVRGAAAVFGISKSTVHKDVSENLRREDPALYEEVRKLLDKNREERHLRGGEATRKKYAKEALS
ncbi:MAG: sporulation transcriptional regulator SpoIIID [Clostridia bacterium]|nr:sporulation transcriptional regulator SpoIIID [Clostridia bacterium]